MIEKYKFDSGVVGSKRLLNQAVEKSLRTHSLKPGAQVMRKNEKITALYERLSRDDFGKDDDQQRESNSISNQKAMLEEFAASALQTSSISQTMVLAAPALTTQFYSYDGGD